MSKKGGFLYFFEKYEYYVFQANHGDRLKLTTPVWGR